MVYINPKKILVEFLRSKMYDPRARAEDTKTESFTASTDQKIFSLTPDSSLSCVTEVKLNSTTQSKWENYYVDLDRTEIGFYNGLNDSDSVEVTYKQGTTNWIYWDKPYVKLSPTSFPRISVLTVTAPGSRLGQYNAPIEYDIQFQIDVWAKEKQDGQIFNIDCVDYYGDSLVEKLGHDANRALEQNFSEMFPILYALNIVSAPRDMSFDVDYQSFRRMLEVELRTLNLGNVGDFNG